MSEFRAHQCFDEVLNGIVQNLKICEDLRKMLRQAFGGIDAVACLKLRDYGALVDLVAADVRRLIHKSEPPHVGCYN
jgi:hypothetical protein